MTKCELLGSLESHVIGQDHVLRAIAPYIVMHMANLSPEGRPLGIFLLLGPTGTGKTHTVQSLANVLHGSSNSMIRIDCAEFSLEHEVAKLLGSPPGYLGHRETPTLITQAKLNNVTSNTCSASIVLFDEIEKSAPSFHRALLGIMDHGTLTIGDNTRVSFESSLVFMTSNLGASGIKALMSPYGLPSHPTTDQLERSIEDVAVAASRRFFTPEFFNRIDCVTTYRPLTSENARRILHLKLVEVERLIRCRKGKNIFRLHITGAARDRLTSLGFSREYGGREINRVIARYIMQPLSEMIVEDGADALASASFDVINGEIALLRSAKAAR